MTITREDVQKNLDPRSTEEILAGLPHYGNKYEEGFEHSCYYHAYSAVAKLLRPEAVVEIGVKRGYSLVTIVRAFPGVRSIVGIDNEGWVPGSQKMAWENLCAAGYKGKLELPITVSRGFARRLMGKFDLVHVDGEHTYDGARLDMIEYWPLLRPGGVMIVDDLQAVDVMRAVVEVVPKLPGRTNDFYFPTGTGWRVVVK